LKLPELPVDVPLPAVVLKVEKIFAVLVLPHCGHAICTAPWGRSVNRSNVVPHASQRYSKMGIDSSLIIGKHMLVPLIDQDIPLCSEVKTCSKKIVYLQMWFIASAILYSATTACCTSRSGGRSLFSSRGLLCSVFWSFVAVQSGMSS
jgi:hypothetical protein